MGRALFSAVLGRTVPLHRRGELAACFPANPFPPSAWIFCLFAVMERLNGRALKGFFFLWTSFLPKINHHVGLTVTGNIGTVFIFFNLILHVCESVDFSKSILDRRPRSWRRPGDTWRGRAWRSRVPGRHREEAVKAGEIVFICLSGSAPRSSGALLEGRALPAGEVMGSLFRPLHPGALGGETLCTDWTAIPTINKQQTEKVVSKGFDLNQTHLSLVKLNHQHTENTWGRSETWAEHFSSLGESRRHLQIWLRKPQTISGGIYHPSVLCPLM